MANSHLLVHPRRKVAVEHTRVGRAARRRVRRAVVGELKEQRSVLLDVSVSSAIRRYQERQ